MGLKDKTLTKYGITISYPMNTIIYCAVLVAAMLVTLFIAIYGASLESFSSDNTTLTAALLSALVWMISYWSWIIAAAKSHGTSGVAGILLATFLNLLGLIIFAVILGNNPATNRLSEKEGYEENNKIVLNEIYSSRIIGITALINVALFTVVCIVRMSIF